MNAPDLFQVSLALIALPLAVAWTPLDLDRQERIAEEEVAAEPVREAFDVSLAEIHTKANRGKWKAAREELVGLLEDYQAAPWIMTRAGEVRERLRSYAFWMSHERPTVQDALLGDVKKYSASSGTIEVHYEWMEGAQMRHKPYDFIAVGDKRNAVWVHPAVFSGPYSIEVQGKGASGASLFGGLVARDHFDEASFSNKFGSQIVRCRDGEFTPLDAATLDYKGGSHYRFVFEVQSRRVRASVKGRTVLKGERPKDEPWGHCGMRAPFGLLKVIVRGEVDPGWVNGLIDEKVQASLAVFEEEYDDGDGIPPAIVERMGVNVPRAEDIEETYPGEKTAHLDDLVKRFWQRARSGASTGAHRELEKLEESEPESFRRWLTFWTAIIDDDMETAKSECDAVIELAPDFYWAHHVRANLRSQELSPKDAMAEALVVAELFPKRAEPATRYASMLLFGGDLQGAKAAFDRALVGGAPVLRMEPLRKMLLGAEHGPSWDRFEEWKGKHYMVRSSMGLDRAAEAGRELENSYARWNHHLRRLPKSKRGMRASVYLFGGEASYHAYTSQILDGPAENTAGVFISSMQQLLIWNLPDREEWKRTIRHEGFHQFLDRLAPSAPIWFHEGMAQYYETSHHIRGRWIEGAVRDDLLRQLRKTRMIPLRNFLALDSAGFMRNAARNYAQAWAFVHFLQHSKDRRYKKCFDAFLDAMIEGSGAKEAFDEALGHTPHMTLNSLDDEFEKYVRGLG